MLLRMVILVTIYERIRQRRKELNLSADEVAKALNVSRATIYRYESSEIEKLPLNILEPLAKVLKTTPSYLMGWEESPIKTQEIEFKINLGDKNLLISDDEKRRLTETIVLNLTDAIEEIYPQIDHISESTGDKLLSLLPIYEKTDCNMQPEDIKDFLSVPLSSSYEDCFVLKINDDSLEPKISTGDLLIIKKSTDYKTNDIVALCIDDSSLIVRQIKVYDNGIYILALNPSIEPLFYRSSELSTMEITIIGKLIESRTYWS